VPAVVVSRTSKDGTLLASPPMRSKVALFLRRAILAHRSWLNEHRLDTR
jgi:hypothetical protein